MASLPLADVGTLTIDDNLLSANGLVIGTDYGTLSNGNDVSVNSLVSDTSTGTLSGSLGNTGGWSGGVITAFSEFQNGLEVDTTSQLFVSVPTSSLITTNVYSGQIYLFNPNGNTNPPSITFAYLGTSSGTRPTTRAMLIGLDANGLEVVTDLAGPVNIIDSTGHLKWSALSGVPSTFNPTPHESTHITGGSDLIPVATSSATGVVPVTPNNSLQFLAGGATASFTTLPLNTITQAGTVATAPNDVTKYWRGDATWAQFGGEVPYFNHFYDFDDVSPSYKYFTGSSGTGASVNGVNNWGEEDHRGVASVANGTTASSYAWISGASFIDPPTSGSAAFRAWVFLSGKPTTTGTASAKIFLGIGTIGNGATEPVDFIGYLFDPAQNATNWVLCTRKASTSTYTNTSFAFTANAWADLRFKWTSSGVVFRAQTWNSALQTTSSVINTNISTNDLGPLYAIFAGASCTTQYFCYADLWHFSGQQAHNISRDLGSDLVTSF